MQRRHLLLIATLAGHPLAQAQNLAGISSADAGLGLKTALERGALAAVGLLGQTGGFLNNPQVRIPLPGALQDAAKLLKAIGYRKQLEELETAMNRAAEQAVPLAKDLLVNAVRGIGVADAKNILTGGDTSVTAFFADKTRAPLTTQFLPVVTKATERVGAAQRYNEIAAKAGGMGLVKQEDATVQQYVTRKALDGLYLVIGEQERAIRANPVGTGSAILQRVFGAMR